MNEKKKQNGSATKEEGRNCDKHVGGEWSNLDKQIRGRRRREGNKMFFGGNENTLVLLLLRFRGKQLLRRFDVSRDESVSLLQLPRPRFFFFFLLFFTFFIPPFSTSWIIPYVLFPLLPRASYTLDFSGREKLGEENWLPLKRG